MIACPICSAELHLPVATEHNCYQCATCDVFVFAICDPENVAIRYPALSNDNRNPMSVPDDVLYSEIVDQSPVSDPPRILIIEFSGKTACIYATPKLKNDQFHKSWCKNAEKAATILNRQMFLTTLPLDLMNRIRNRNEAENAG